MCKLKRTECVNDVPSNQYKRLHGLNGILFDGIICKRNLCSLAFYKHIAIDCSPGGQCRVSMTIIWSQLSDTGWIQGQYCLHRHT